MTISTFFDPGFHAGTISKAPPPQSAAPAGRPIITGPLSLANLMRLIPEDGHNWIILMRLWERREEPLLLWRLINKLADEFGDLTRSEKRSLKTAIWKDLDFLIQKGWVIRHGGRIQLNLVRLSGQTGL